MSYTGTQAQAGFGSSLWVYTSTGVPTSPSGTGWVNLGEATGATQSGTINKTDDATNFNSTAEEFVATILAPGSYKFSMNRVPADAGQAQLLTNFANKSLNYYALVLPKSPTQTTLGDAFVFRALVEELPKAVEPEKIIKYSVTLKISGAETFYAGS